MHLRWAVIMVILGFLGGAAAQNVTYRWVYRNPFSILDPNAVDTGRGSRNGTVNSVLSRVPRTYQPRLRYCHMATLSHLPNGSIAAQWQANTKWYEGALNQSIYWAVSDDAGLTWGPTRLLTPSPDGLPLWGPVQYSANNTMHLWYSKSHSACSWEGPSGLTYAPGGDLLFGTLRDTAQTWNTTTIVPWSYEGGIARLTCNGVSLNAKGEWLLPYWRELGGPEVCQQRLGLFGTAGVLITADQGKTYTKVNVPKDNSTWMIENAIAQYRGSASKPDMHVQTFRTTTGTALQSWSSNGGLNWTYPVNSTLPNPNSRMDIISLPNNTLAAAFNDSPDKRTPLRLATSTDGGVTWTRQALIENDPVGSFHYPALLYDSKNDTVLVIYTVGYPPRLVPVSLVLPGLDVRSSSIFASVPDTAPAPAPGASAKAPAVTPAVSAPAGGAKPPAAIVQLAGRVLAVNRTAQAPTASFQSKAIKASTYSATTNGTGAKAPAAAATPDLRRDGSRDALARTGRRLAQGAPLEQGAGQMQERAVPVSSANSGRVRVEDVLAHVEGGVDEMSDEEVLENTVLAEQHEELLNTHGYRLVEGLPGYVLEPNPRGVREAEMQSFQSRSNRDSGDAAATTDASEGAAAASSAAQGRRKLLKERYVEEETDYGRVSYGMRVATVNRLALVHGLISPKLAVALVCFMRLAGFFLICWQPLDAAAPE